MDSLYRHAGAYWIKYYQGGRPFRKSAHTDKMTEAKRLLASAHLIGCISLAASHWLDAYRCA